MSVNNIKKIGEGFKASDALKRRIRGNVQTNIGIVKFIGNVVDLYLGNAGRVMTNMLNTFEENDKPHAAEDRELPPVERERLAE